LIVVGADAWEKGELEVAGGVFKTDDGKFQFLYHGLQHDSDYQVGLATADHPNGPWIRSAKNPILPKGSGKGDWDGGLAASANVLHNGTHWQMWYIGAGTGAALNEDASSCGSFCVGYATAPALDGPWTKYYKGGSKGGGYIIASEDSADKALKKPFNTDGFYTGSVMYGAHTNYEYWLYCESPVGDYDQGPLALWTSKTPTGPFSKRQYILLPGAAAAKNSSWAKGGYSESKVVYLNDLFYMFFTGADGSSEDDDLDDDRTPPPSEAAESEPSPPVRRRRTRGERRHASLAAALAADGTQTLQEGGEGGLQQPGWGSNEPENIGFAVSKDGVSFVLSQHNPIGVHHESTPWNAAMAEGHALVDVQDELVYVYHTQRWNNGGFDPESLGVEIMASKPDFRVENMRVISGKRLSGGTTVKAGATTACSLCQDDVNKETCTGCQPLKSHITGTGLPPVNASIELAVTGSCGAGSKTASATVHMYSSKQGKYNSGDTPLPKKPTASFPLPATACSGTDGSFKARVVVGKTPAPWNQFTITNTGSGVLTNVVVAATLIGEGGGPTPPPTPAAPTPPPPPPTPPPPTPVPPPPTPKPVKPTPTPPAPTPGGGGTWTEHKGQSCDGNQIGKILKGGTVEQCKAKCLTEAKCGCICVQHASGDCEMDSGHTSDSDKAYNAYTLKR
jgi:hypothetical protein